VLAARSLSICRFFMGRCSYVGDVEKEMRQQRGAGVRPFHPYGFSIVFTFCVVLVATAFCGI
jgi:hypothetical protein